MKNRMVLDITRMTVHNGPGIRTVISFKGCPLHCVWCSTPESQRESAEIAYYPGKCILCRDCILACPKNALVVGPKTVIIDRDLCDNCGLCVSVCHTEALKFMGRQYTVAELVDEAERDEVVYKHSGGGVTISGGEPLLKPKFTLELVKQLKNQGISAGVDTCGYVNRDNVEAVLPYIDFFLWDIKHMDEITHEKLTGVSNKRILDNLRFTSENGTPIYLRLPVIPGYNDSKENILAVRDFAQTLSSLVEIDLLPLHHLGQSRYAALGREYPLGGILLNQAEKLNSMRSLVESMGLKCKIIG